MSALESVFVVQHAYEDANDDEQVRFIGVYRTRQRAEQAVSRLKSQVGFSDHPHDFHVEEYQLDQDHWVESFANSSASEE